MKYGKLKHFMEMVLCMVTYLVLISSVIVCILIICGTWNLDWWLNLGIVLLSIVFFLASRALIAEIRGAHSRGLRHWL